MGDRLKYIGILTAVLILSGCGGKTGEQTIPILSWGGIPVAGSDVLFPMAKECGFDWHLGLYKSQQDALKAMDAAAEAGIGVIPGFPEIKDSTESAVTALKGHPALIAYHLKDEPETWDINWLGSLNEKVNALDPEHPCYINLYPNWAWNEDKYAEHLELFASVVDTPFYSFDQYPVTEKDGQIHVRPTWYRNLEEFSDMARRYGRPFWAFALSESHHLGAPSPPAFYPVPTLGHLRLQVFSDLLYGAQVIQYFTFRGLYNVKTLEKSPVYDVIRQMNSEIKAYSPVFLGCKVMDVWHTGNTIPSHTTRMKNMPHEKVKSLEMSGEGAVVSLLEKEGDVYLAVQNRDCVNEAVLDIAFKGRVKRFTPDGLLRFDGSPLTLEPGNIAIFRLK